MATRSVGSSYGTGSIRSSWKRTSTSAGTRPARTAAARGSICQVRMYGSPTRRPMHGWTMVSFTRDSPEQGLPAGVEAGQVVGVVAVAEVGRDRQGHLDARPG